MSNMSYCRFRNTEADLVECEVSLVELVDGVDADGEDTRPLDEDEAEAATRLVGTCLDIVELMAGQLGSECGIDSEAAEDFLRVLRKEVPVLIERMNATKGEK